MIGPLVWVDDKKAFRKATLDELPGLHPKLHYDLSQCAFYNGEHMGAIVGFRQTIAFDEKHADTVDIQPLTSETGYPTITEYDLI